MKKSLLMLLTCLSMLTLSCKKSSSINDGDENNLVGNESCNINLCYNMFGRIDYTYDEKNRIVLEDFTPTLPIYRLPEKRVFEYKSDRVTITEKPFEFTYDLILENNRVVKYSLGNQYSKFTYSPDGYITKISVHDNYNDEIIKTKEFKYESGNLASIEANFNVGSTSQNIEKYTFEYYSDKKAIDGVDFALNQFILSDWSLSDYYGLYQFPSTLFGKGSVNLLKKITDSKNGDFLSFLYMFDTNQRVTSFSSRDKTGVVNVTGLRYTCK